MGNRTTGSVTDPDGNVISETSGLPYTFTDTLGMTVLSGSYQGTGQTMFAYTYTGPNSTPETVTLSSSALTIASNFGGCKTDTGATISEYPATSANLLTGISLPDGTAYGFKYEQTPSMPGDYTGRLAEIDLPTGGKITYTYPGTHDGTQCLGNSGDGTVIGLTRQTSDGTWTYTTVAPNTTIQDPSGNQTVVETGFGAEMLRQVYKGSSTSGSLLQTVTTCYNYSAAAPCSTPSAINANGGPPLALTVTRLPTGGKATQTVTYYGLAGLYLPTEVDTYDYGANTPLQVQKITYASLGNILNRPSCVQVRAGTSASSCGTVTSNTKSLTNYLYFSDGNLKQASSWVSGTNYLTRSYTYFSNGLLQTATDVNSNQTTVTYQNCNSTPAYVASVASGGLTTNSTWDCNGGLVTQVKDPNGNATNYGYVGQPPNSTPDPFWRVLSVTDPLGNVTWKTYTPATSTTPATVEGYLNFPILTPTSTVDSLNTLDGLGRLVESQRRTAPGATTFDSAIQYAYGWTATGGVTGPFTTQTVPGGTAVTKTQFDALGRGASVLDGGGGSLSVAYTQNDVLRTVGPAPTGEQTKQRQIEYDALGRITSVCEISSTLTGTGTCTQASSLPTGYFTTYTYDSPVNSVTVSQNAQGTAQARSYQYDGLGRLISESNPESGTKTYVYDSDSSMCGAGTYTSNGDLVKTTDAAGNCVMYYSDTLHRVTDVGNSNQSVSHCRRFRYDSTSGYPGSTKPTGLTNTLGRLVEAATDHCDNTGDAIMTDEWFSYSARGETTDVYESTPNSGGYYHTTAQYWANGALNTLGGVPGLNGWTFAPDGEGRLLSATYGASTNWVKSATYYPSNSNTTVTYGNGGSGTGDTDLFSYDTSTGRMAGFQFTIGSTPKSLTGTLGWNANGTLGSLGITDQFNTTKNQNCTYGHDDLARINNVTCKNGVTTEWAQTFTLDAFGNINKSGNSPFAAGYLLTNGTTNNQEQSVGSCIPTYDGNGNLTKDCGFATPPTYAWDAYGCPTSLSGMNLICDALGRETEITSGSTHTQILYSPIGKLGLMSGQAANTIRIPLPGGSTAELLGATGGTTHILHPDWLGSGRISTAYTNRSLVYDTAYAPYGESYDGTSSDLNFTGQSQDTLSGLYDFLYREYNPVQGRWLSPDPVGLGAVDVSNPQTWNRYAYVGNTPLNTVDPQGLMNYSVFLATLGYLRAAADDLGVLEGFVWGSDWNEFDLMNIPVTTRTFTPPQAISTPIAGMANEFGEAVSVRLYIPAAWSNTVIGNGFDLFGAANNGTLFAGVIPPGTLRQLADNAAQNGRYGPKTTPPPATRPVPDPNQIPPGPKPEPWWIRLWGLFPGGDGTFTEIPLVIMPAAQSCAILGNCPDMPYQGPI